MRFTITSKGDFSKTQRFLNRMSNKEYLNVLDDYGKLGCERLSKATPKKTGKTADSWYYVIKHDYKNTTISWHNSNTNKGVPIAIVLEYGHGTKSKAYVKGRHYIDPAIRPILDELANRVWEEVER